MPKESKYQRYRNRKKQLSAQQCPVCQEATFWEHRVSCPKVKTQASALARACASGASVEAVSEFPRIAVEEVCGNLIGNAMRPVASTSLAVTSSDEQVELGERISVTVNKDAMLQSMSDLFVKYNLTLKQRRGVLSFISRYIPGIPCDPRTICHTPRLCQKIQFDGGVYIHLGLKDGLIICIKSMAAVPDSVDIQLNVDGMSIYRSSTIQLWPILARVVRPASTPIVTVGVYCGSKKPQNLNEYMHRTLEELKDILQNGLSYRNALIRCHLLAIVCDTPARAFVRQVKSPAGYFGCDKCNQRGVYIDGRMTFPIIEARARTDGNFRARKYRRHHIGDSPFLSVSIDMVHTFPLDYMHLVCLGVTQRLLTAWLKGSRSSSYRLSRAAAEELGDRILRTHTSLSCDFQRKCRHTSDIERWKATEFRQFLLYLGPQNQQRTLPMRKYLTLNFVFLLVQLVSCNIFLLYDVFQSEGFNLRRDVYIRVVNVLRLLREPSKLPPGVGVAFSHSDTTDLNWTLVLPPWGPLPHWFAASHGSVSDSETSWQQFVGLRWSNFFDISSLNHVVPVIEFEEFQNILSKSHPQSANTRPQIDLVLNLIRQYENLRTDRQRGVRFCPPDLLRSHKIANDPIPISLFQAYLITNQTELVSPIASRYECITGDLEPVYLAPFLHQIVHNKSLFTTKPVWSIFLGGAESIIHGLWSEWSQEYWTVRRSMVFASHLRQIADQFRAKYLASNDHSDRTLMPKPTQSQLTGSAWMRASWPLAPALGGPFLAVHWRCGDFVSHLTGRWNYTPSPALAAKQIAEAAQNQKLDVVYLATDASESDVKELEDELAPITVVRFVPSDSDWSHLGPGEIAIIDQWICAHARFFMGTSPSTFTFRITEERTIMGFTPESTFNTLCASGQARYYTNGQDKVDGETDNCEALTFWSIKLEPEYTVPSATSSLPLRSQDEL